MTVLNPVQGVPVPAPLLAFVDHFIEAFDPKDLEKDLLLLELKIGDMLLPFDLDTSILAARLPVALHGRSDPSPELGYQNHPFEFFPFAWQGGDALQYGLLIHDTRLAEDFPVGSFSPADDAGVRWLGDDTRQGLENLFSAEMARSEKHADQLRKDPGRRALWARLGIEPDRDATRLGPGARSQEPIRPQVPAGWRYEPTPNGAGVLAPAECFDPDLPALPDAWDVDAHLSQARGLLNAGLAGSALRRLYEAFEHSIGERVGVVQVMRDAYAALDRPFLVSRVDAYLKHPSRR